MNPVISYNYFEYVEQKFQLIWLFDGYFLLLYREKAAVLVKNASNLEKRKL